MSKNTRSKKENKLDSTVVSLDNSFPLEEIGFKLDESRIEACERKLNEAREENFKKVYAIKFGSAKDVNNFFEFIANEAEWKEREALGVIEICKLIDSIKKEKIKDNIIFLNAIPLEASYYFLSKKSGRGFKEAEEFISIMKPLGIALEMAKQDASIISGLEKELAAAQQGIDLV